ncbi:D-alanyl-D-alanine carboxypeptidase/D-alanyl-D-alanine-endopeptidase [Hydrogenovibrio halophilus]|uniref:D-alanyl-D-alanine carboxypeptidase/D-alanyl-D-alanine-endopeptidase n=1 Tax=Hydrogenovibrio halophilus TaxID=373391 RepID=UPI00036C2B82|nr:D-alanyl-D-alanine carboxypeptidase [Hydrogenovibrio halophilus]
MCQIWWFIHAGVQGWIRTGQVGLAGLMLCLLSPVQADPQSVSWTNPTHLSELSVWAGSTPESQMTLTVQDNVPRIPASTVKLVTALLALETWSPQTRFHTDVFARQTASGWSLKVKGYGDPFLVSETLQQLAESLADQLTGRGIGRIERLVMDDHYFAVASETVRGLSTTDNPYDALPTALMANFNTLNLKRVNGRIESAEAQTPLTPLARKVGAERLPRGPKSARINLGQRPERAARYVGELLQAFLAEAGISVDQVVRAGREPEQGENHQAWSKTPFLRFENPKPVAEQVRAMLKYSTNLIAHHLVLKLSAERYGAPATMDKVARYLSETLSTRFGWSQETLVEGSGLARENRLTARQLGQVLAAFAPWRSLLPEEREGVWAKTGTLHNVSTLAGYVCPERCEAGAVPFVWMANETVPWDLRWRFAQSLRQRLQASQAP